MVTNPAKFQIMFLGSKFENSNITFAIENKQIKCKREVKLLGITITYTKRITDICSLVNNRLRDLKGIRRFLLTEQTKYLSQAYIFLVFKYYPLILMLHYKTSNIQWSKIHKRTPCLVYEMEDTNFEDLLLKGYSRNVYENNIYTLLIKVYKSINKSTCHERFFLTWKILDLISDISKCSNYLKPILRDMVHNLSALKSNIECGFEQL